MKKYNKCWKCGSAKSLNISKTCMKCAGKVQSIKMKNNLFALKDGHTTQKYYCICGKELYNFRSKRCISCENKRRHELEILNIKGKNNPFFGKSRMGKLNPRYIDGRSYEYYPACFTEKLKEEIRKRDNYICQFCGMIKKEHFKLYNRNLEVHHKNHNRNDCRKRNLLTTCKKCNIKERDKQ